MPVPQGIYLPYTIDGVSFPTTPIKVDWTYTQIGTRGDGQPIFSPYWVCNMEFSYMTANDKAFFWDYFNQGGYHSIVVPHPRDDNTFILFTGTVITKFDAQRFDVAGYSQNPKLQFSRVLVTGVTIL